jgi:hypothetical protein
VEYENENEAEDAMAALKDKDFAGLPINVGKQYYYLTSLRMEQAVKTIRRINFNKTCKQVRTQSAVNFQ